MAGLKKVSIDVIWDCRMRVLGSVECGNGDIKYDTPLQFPICIIRYRLSLILEAQQGVCRHCLKKK